MKYSKQLKKAGILLITAALIFSTTAVTANTQQSDKTHMLLSDSKTNSASSSPISEPLSGSILFEQLPHEPDDSWSAATSCLDLDHPTNPIDYIVYENFWEVTDAICDIHWWGVSLLYSQTSGWSQCDPDGMTFNIIFYEDNNGVPGDEICNYDNVAPKITDTGWIYRPADIAAHGYLFEYDFDPCCQIETGWVSIQSYATDSHCWFLWMSAKTGDGDSLQDVGAGPVSTNYDRALRLTGEGPPPIPAICCEGSLYWEEVSPGATVTGTFQVCNCGEPGSYLKWQFDSAPSWPGAIWEIEPDSGEGLAEGDCVTITVNVTAPPDKNTKFEGKIKMINRENASDFCEVDVVLITPKTKAFNVNPLFQRWLERHPNLFPILQQILGI